jgi:two-component system chemotaxis response regulator CheY
MKVLVVDDSEIVRDRLVAMIRELGAVHQVGAARNADEALELVRETAPDLVVLDIHMPGTSGIAVLPALKALPLAPCVVALTNDAGEAHRRQCLALGADYFFDKAREFERVLEVIAARSARRHSPRP